VISKRREIVRVERVSLHKTLMPFARILDCFFLIRDVEGVHFCSKTDEFSRWHRHGFALELAKDTIICFRVELVRRFKVTRVEQM